jgi:hypothetical protein
MPEFVNPAAGTRRCAAVGNLSYLPAATNHGVSDEVEGSRRETPHRAAQRMVNGQRR